jgi:ribonuclease E
MPNNPRGGGVSRRVEGEDRQELREAIDQLDLPPGMSVIARTAGLGRAVEELQWDLKYLLQLWKAITDAVQQVKAPELIYLESSLVIRAIRDYFHPEIGEILIDTEDVYNQATTFVDLVMPDVSARVKRYRDDVPLFSRFQIEHQIETAHSRQVPLPSGGAIVIDHTEALVAIDVNSAQATRGSDIEETALRTNLEAADEVARQLRLRDLGGLIVIDFIDMEDARNQRAVEQRLKEALHHDRARVQMGKISRFGMMELSRQRLRPALSEGSHVTCPRCNGVGQVRDTDSSALHILRILQEEAMKENTAAVHAQVPVDVATYLLNEKRPDLAKLEARLKVSIVLIPNKFLETPHYSIERMKHDDERLDQVKPSYDRVTAPSEDEPYSVARGEEARVRRQEAVVKGVVPETPAPLVPATIVPAPTGPAAPAGPSLWSRIVGWFAAGPQPEPVPAVAAPAAVARGRPERERHGRGERGSERRETRGHKSQDRGPEKTGQGRGERSERGREQAPRKERAAAPARPEQADERSKRRGGRGGEGAGRAGRESRAQADGSSESRPAIEALAPASAPGGASAGKPAATVLTEAGKPDVAPPGEDAGEERRGRRRRRRGRGSERGDRPGAGMSGNGPVAVDVERQDAAPRRAPATIGQADQIRPAPVDKAPVVVEPAPERVSVAQPIAVPKETPRPRAIEPAPMAVAELLPIVESSGMKLAQTDPQKLAAAQARADSLQPPPVRVGRERPVLPPVEEAPLTQVATRDQP